MILKKIISIVALSTFSTLVNAWGGCTQYKVHINNTGSADCVLKKHYILYGKLTQNAHIPDVIFRGQQAQFEMINPQSPKFIEAGALLGYECGDDKEVTFFTTTHMQQPSILYTDTSLSAVIESKNMDVSFQAQRCNNAYSRPNEITWVLNP